MQSQQRTALTDRDVATIARSVDLPLAEGRAALLLPTINAWLHGIDELNRKMSSPHHRDVTPIVVFHHPARSGRP